MLLAVPYETIELAKLQIDPFHTDRRQRRIAPLLYKDAGLTFTGCSILCPPLPISHYDPVSNRLKLEMTNRVFGLRLYAMQDYLANHLFTSRVIPDLSLREIHGILQKLYLPSSLTVYAYPTTPVQTNSGLKDLASLEPGSSLRMVLRIHGLLLLENRGAPHVRIQHSIVALNA